MSEVAQSTIFLNMATEDEGEVWVVVEKKVGVLRVLAGQNFVQSACQNSRSRLHRLQVKKKSKKNQVKQESERGIEGVFFVSFVLGIALFLERKIFSL